MTLSVFKLFEVDFSLGHRAMVAAQSFEQATNIASKIRTFGGQSRGEVIGVHQRDLFETTSLVWIDTELIES